MSALNFKLRISDEMMKQLKREAEERSMSVNALILSIIEKKLGTANTNKGVYRLEHFAGSWSSAAAKAFEQIEESLDFFGLIRLQKQTGLV